MKPHEFATTALAAALLSIGAAAVAADQPSARAELLAQRDTARSQPAKADARSAVPAADRKFMEKAAAHGIAEVELGKLAQQKAGSERVKQFGSRMVDDHGKANDELQAIASAKGVSLPTEMDAEHRKKMERLQKLSGADFDKAYMADMVKDHRNDVAEFRKRSKAAKDAEVKGFAAKNLPTLEEHLRLAQDAEKATRVASAK